MRARDKGFSQASAHITDKKPNHAGKPAHTQPCFRFLAWGHLPSPLLTFPFHTSASSRTSLGASFQRETGCCGDLGMNTCVSGLLGLSQPSNSRLSTSLGAVHSVMVLGDSLPSSPRVRISTLSHHEGFCSAVPLPWAVVLTSTVTTTQGMWPHGCT